MFRNYVLNWLTDSLYKVYYKFEADKELQESLERKYMVKDAPTKKHNVAKFLEHEIVDSKSFMIQV